MNSRIELGSGVLDLIKTIATGSKRQLPTFSPAPHPFRARNPKPTGMLALRNLEPLLSCLEAEMTDSHPSDFANPSKRPP